MTETRGLVCQRKSNLVERKSLKRNDNKDMFEEHVTKLYLVTLYCLTNISKNFQITLFFLDCKSDIVPFLSGLLLTSDSKVKDWLADFIRTAQKVCLVGWLISFW